MRFNKYLNFLVFFIFFVSCKAISEEDLVSFSENFLRMYYSQKDIRGFRGVLHPLLIEDLDSKSSRMIEMWSFEKERVKSWDLESLVFVSFYEKKDEYRVEFELYGEFKGKETKKNTMVSLKKHDGEWKIFALR